MAEDKKAKPAPTDVKSTDAAKAESAKPEAGKPEAKSPAKGEAKPEAKPEAKSEAQPEAKAEVAAPEKAEPWPDATPQPMRPVEAPPRAQADTEAMAALAAVGSPPELPAASPAAPVQAGAVEDPTFMPGPKQVPGGAPTDPAAPPGRVPPGDSRSLRRGNEFALVYRVQTAVITRSGVVGQRGQWRVVDYPTSSSASNAYAKEASRFVSEGFSDYRD